MADLSTYNRAGHNAACPCKDCIAYDCEVFYQSRPQGRTGLRDISGWVEKERQRALNWTLEPGHCLLCAGILWDVSRVAEHYVVRGHNILDDANKVFISYLVHKAGSQMATYRYILRNDPIKGLAPKVVKSELIKWAAGNMALNPEKCFALASREHAEWIEIRLGFTELDFRKSYDPVVRWSENYAARRGENDSGVGQAAGSTGGPLQGTLSMAR